MFDKFTFDNRYLIYLVICAFLLIFVGGFFLFGPEDPIRNYPSSGSDIIAFGDSLIEGVGANNGKDFVSLLSQKIGKPIINLGVSGNTTAQGLAQIKELDRYKPKVVLLLLGGNDHLRKVPIAETFDNLGKIIEQIHARGAIVLLLGVRGSILSDQFAEHFEELAEKYDTAFVPDILNGLFGRSQYMSDAIHPNDVGYAIIADRVYEVLKPLLTP